MSKGAVHLQGYQQQRPWRDTEVWVAQHGPSWPRVAVRRHSRWDCLRRLGQNLPGAWMPWLGNFYPGILSLLQVLVLMPPLSQSFPWSFQWEVISLSTELLQNFLWVALLAFTYCNRCWSDNRELEFRRQGIYFLTVRVWSCHIAVVYLPLDGFINLIFLIYKFWVILTNICHTELLNVKVLWKFGRVTWAIWVYITYFVQECTILKREQNLDSMRSG